MGLHINIGHAQLPDPQLREHRIRVWWSAYSLDRFLSSKIGLPLLISDDDILVDLPAGNPALNPVDFGDHLHFVAVLRLAKIAGKISRSLYVRKSQRGTFLHRVEKIGEELDQWREQLPDRIKTEFDCAHDGDGAAHPATTALKLSFNQLRIVAMRPVLLFAFRCHIGEITMGGAADDTLLQHTTQAVSDTCVRAARESLQLLSQCWIGGGFRDFNYSHVQYLFSAAVILAIASTLTTSPEDSDEFNLAASFLHQLEQNGNFAAMEFCSHVQETQRVLEQFRMGNRESGAALAAENPKFQPATQPIPGDNDQTAAADGGLAAHSHDPESSLPMDLSFLDDWIYDNALEQLCWEGPS